MIIPETDKVMVLAKDLHESRSVFEVDVIYGTIKFGRTEEYRSEDNSKEGTSSNPLG